LKLIYLSLSAWSIYFFNEVTALRSPSTLFYIVFPFINHSSSANRLKFRAIRQYFDKKGILILSAKFLTEQFPNEFSDVGTAKNYLRRVLRIDFNPFETTDKYIIKTNVDTYDMTIPADAKNPDTLNFYKVRFEGQRGHNTMVISRYDYYPTIDTIFSITKRPLKDMYDCTPHNVNTHNYINFIERMEYRRNRRYEKKHALRIYREHAKKCRERWIKMGILEEMNKLMLVVPPNR